MACSTVRANGGQVGRSQQGGTQQSSTTQSTQSDAVSQRVRRRDNEEDEGEDEDAVEDEVLDEADEEDEERDETRKAHALVRLALFNESRHMPLRRDEINKKVLGENTKRFSAILSTANRILRSTFGMELVELMSRADLLREQNANDEVRDGANATGLKKKTTTSGSKSYILRSTLAQDLIQIAAEADEQLVDLEINEDGDEDDEDAIASYGSIINWTSADQLSGLGLLYVILSVILVNGHSMSDPELKSHLKTFRLPMSAAIEFVPHGTTKSMTIEQYLALLVRQGQLDKVKLNAGGAPRPTQGKRGRNVDDTPDEAASYEWRWGPRAHAEVGERAIAEFIAEFMAERVIREYEKSGDEEGEGRRMSEDEREKVLAGFMRDINRATGGKLSDVV